MEICGIPHLTQRTRQIWGTQNFWKRKISTAKSQLGNVGRRTLPNPEQRAGGETLWNPLKQINQPSIQQLLLSSEILDIEYKSVKLSRIVSLLQVNFSR